jgi:hypothetical protein
MRAQNLPNGSLRTGKAHGGSLQERVSMQIIQDRFRTGKALEVFRRRITHLQNALDDQWLVGKRGRRRNARA